MSYDREQFQQKLVRWRSYMEDFRLPSWEALPDMELYMDQVISLANRYLNLFPQDDTNPVITASAVNNYVRLRMMPAPERKRYSRHHMACVIMICVLKQSLSLAEIQRILPLEMTEEVYGGPFRPFFRQDIVEFSKKAVAAYERLAAEEGFLFFDANKYAKCGLPDGVHLDAENHVALGKAFAAWVKENL